METIFDFLNSILFSKIRKKFNCETSSTYIPFMINRWCTMYNKDLANIVNITTNKYTNLSKEEHFNFLRNFLPKLPFKRIEYIKKKNSEKEETSEIAMLAKNLELSKREINHYIICQDHL